jgi:hypothetical protein
MCVAMDEDSLKIIWEKKKYENLKSIHVFLLS